MKNILVTQRAKKNKYGCDVDVLEQAYVSYLEKFEVRLILIPNSTSQLAKYFDINLQIHGIILSGGNDVSPELYGGDDKLSSDISTARDHCEKKVLDIAIKKKIPVFGICRGLQFINVYFGGRINQDIHQKHGDTHRPAQDHKLIIKENSIIDSLSSKGLTTNSFHNQGVFVEDLSVSLKTFVVEEAVGLVEGLYHPHLPIAAVQWHPERGDTRPLDTLLTKSFLARKLFWQ